MSFSLESFKNSRRVCFRNSMYIDNSDFRITRLDLEVSGLAAFLLFIWSGEQMAALVSLTNSGYFDEAVKSIFGGTLGWGARSLIIIILNGCAIFLTFAVWYYLVTCWGDITVIGIRQFVRERSLLYRCFGTICGWTKGKINDFKEEILHVDFWLGCFGNLFHCSLFCSEKICTENSGAVPEAP